MLTHDEKTDFSQELLTDTSQERGRLAIGTPLENEIVDAMCDLYVSFRQRFNICIPGGIYFMPKKKKGPLPLGNAHLLNHLRRQYAVAIYAGEKTSKFLCFDVDTNDRQVVFGILAALEMLGIPGEYLHVSTSGNKGFHIDLFFDGLMNTKDLKKLYVHLKSLTDMRKVEFRPTRTQSIKLPLTAHGKTGNICWYLDRGTQEAIEDPAYILRITPFSVTEMEQILQAQPEESVPISYENTRRQSGGGTTLREGLPGDKIVEAGTRHALMVRLGAKGRIDGLSEDECRKTLEAWRHQQDDQLIESTPAQIAHDIDRIISWAYGPKFVMQSKAKETVPFDEKDFRIVLMQKTRSMRKFMLLLIALEKARSIGLSTEKMSAIIGVSRKMILLNITRMESEGTVIRTQRKAIRNEDGSFFRPSNTYKVCYGCLPSEGGDIGSTASVDITMATLLEFFADVYYGTMIEMMNKTGIQDKTIRAEWEKIVLERKVGEDEKCGIIGRGEPP